MRRGSILKLVIGLFVLVVIGIIGGYFYLSHTKTTLNAVNEENGATGGVAPIGDSPAAGGYENSVGSSLNPMENGVPRLRKISVTPVAGADIFDRKENGITKTFIRFVDRGEGHIYETPVDSLETSRVTNTTIPKISEAMFGSGGNTVVYRYTDSADNVQTFVGKISATSSDLTGRFLSINASPFVFSPSKNKFFYMVRGGNGAVGYISDFANKTSQVLNQGLQKWQASWPNENSLVLVTSPTSAAGGVAYQFNIGGGTLTKLIGPLNGLVVLPSPKIDTLLFSTGRNSTLFANFYEIKTGSQSSLASPTLPDKCLWSETKKIVYCGTPKFVPPGQYPDAWYQGLISFDDRITQSAPGSSDSLNIIDPGVISGERMDAINLHLSPDENYLIFTNKVDLSLWGLRLN